MLSSHLRLQLTFRFYGIYILHEFLISPMRAKCTTLVILLYSILRMMRSYECKFRRFSSCSFHLSPVTSSLLGPTILLRPLTPNILYLCSFVKMTEQVSHPHKIIGKIIVLCFLIFNLSKFKIFSRVWVTLDGVLAWILDLLTALTHNS
jgi:hypothetical protein